MKIAVIGKGGREHALVKALKESPSAPEMYCFPGSDAINRLATPIPARDLPSLIDWMVSNKMDLCVAGEDDVKRPPDPEERRPVKGKGGICV